MVFVQLLFHLYRPSRARYGTSPSCSTGPTSDFKHPFHLNVGVTDPPVSR